MRHEIQKQEQEESSEHSKTNLNNIFNDDHNTDKLHVLAQLFLFGLALDKTTVRSTLDEGDLEVLLSSKLLCVNPMDSNEDKDDNDKNDNHEDGGIFTLLFMMDWPLESLRLTRDAIMPVGYDTLELLALSSGINKHPFHNNSTWDTTNEKVRILDLCCGCGIQGIYTSACMAKVRQKCDDCDSRSIFVQELTSMDINLRACHFVTGNSCLNDLKEKLRMDVFQRLGNGKALLQCVVLSITERWL